MRPFAIMALVGLLLFFLLAPVVEAGNYCPSCPQGTRQAGQCPMPLQIVAGVAIPQLPVAITTAKPTGSTGLALVSAGGPACEGRRGDRIRSAWQRTKALWSHVRR